MDTLQRSDPEVNLITNFIMNIKMLTIIVGLLTRLSSLQTLSDYANLIFCFLDHVRTKELSFAGFGPVQRCSTCSPIQELERCHAQTGLKTVVIGELRKRKTFLP